MFSEAKLILFFTATILMILTPGPAVIYIVARGISQGRRSALVSVMGIGLGNLSHAVAAALGLSALFASSPAAYSALKYIGAAYLIYLGIRKLFSKSVAIDGMPPKQESDAAVFREGLWVGLLNPKIALFFLAFLPQFATPGTSPIWLQLLILGATFVLLGYIGDSCFALVSGTFGKWLRRHPKFANAERYISATVYCALGVIAAVSK